MLYQNKIQKTTIKTENENKNLKEFFNILSILSLCFSLKYVDKWGKILFKKNHQITIKTSIIFIGTL